MRTLLEGPVDISSSSTGLKLGSVIGVQEMGEASSTTKPLPRVHNCFLPLQAH